MKAKTTARLCQASFVAGALLTPPLKRKTKEQADLMAKRGARGYVKLREKMREAGRATGRPGQYAVIAGAFALQMGKDAAHRFGEYVTEAEGEMAAKKADKFGLYAPPEPVTTIEDYVGSPSRVH